MNKFIKWFFIIIAILIGLYAIIMVFGAKLYYETGKRLDIGYGVATSTRKVQLEIGDREFLIPQNYIWSREDWKGGKVTGVNMHTILPHLEGYTEQNKQEFDDSRLHNTATILLREHNIKGSRTSSTSMTREEVYQRNIYDFGLEKPRGLESSSGPYGLTRQQYTKPHDRARNELYIGTLPNGKFYWARCDLKSNVPSPSCKTYFAYSNQTMVSYHFPKDRLKDWQTIDKDIRVLFSQFDTAALRKREREL